MAGFIVRRLLSLVPTLCIIVTLSFFIIKIALGGPFSARPSPA
jgi:oligopeptide transport system permease protein